MPEWLFVCWVISISLPCVLSLFIIVEAHEQGYWHTKKRRLPFKLPWRYTTLVSEGQDKKWVKIYVGGTYLHATLEVDLREDGLYDYARFILTGLGSDYDVRPGIGTDIFAANKAIHHIMRDVQKTTPIKFFLGEKFAKQMDETLTKINNLKVIERIEDEKK